MEKRIVAITTSAVILLGAATSAMAQGTTTQQPSQQQPSATQGGPGTMGPGMMRGGMMEGGMMRHHAMAAPFMRIIFALMDTDGDGMTISFAGMAVGARTNLQGDGCQQRRQTHD